MATDRRGATLVEYIILLGAIALTAVFAFRQFGATVSARAEAQADCVAKLEGCRPGQDGAPLDTASGPPGRIRAQGGSAAFFAARMASAESQDEQAEEQQANGPPPPSGAATGPVDIKSANQSPPLAAWNGGGFDDLERWATERKQWSAWAVEAITGESVSDVPVAFLPSRPNVLGGYDGKSIDIFGRSHADSLAHEYWHVVQGIGQGGSDVYQKKYDDLVQRGVKKYGDRPDKIWDENTFEVEAELAGDWLNKQLAQGVTREQLRQRFQSELLPKLRKAWSKTQKATGISPVHLDKIPRR
jgi:Flp pilus assembly pilin Flp